MDNNCSIVNNQIEIIARIQEIIYLHNIKELDGITAINRIKELSSIDVFDDGGLNGNRK